MRIKQANLLLAITATIGSSEAIHIRNYSATRHNRFSSGFPSAPIANTNPTFIAHGLDLTGVGWYAPNTRVQFALVGRQHVLTATHLAQYIGTNQIKFLSQSGQVIVRNLGNKIVIQDSGNDTDLTLISLDSPIDASDLVTPLPYLNLPNNAAYLGLDAGIVGWTTRIGSNQIGSVEASPRNVNYGGSVGTLLTRFLSHEYPTASGGDDEAYFEPDDSGSPTYVVTGGVAALVGLHDYYVTEDPPGPSPEVTRNFDIFVPHYAAQLNTTMASGGFRMRPANFTGTTLSTNTGTLQTTPRRTKALDFTFQIQNTGGEETGNLEIEFHLDSGEAPESITSPGWVTYGSGAKWTLRKSTFTIAASNTITASWSAAPSIDNLSFTVVHRSDTTSESLLPVTIPLAPSYADWSAGLAQPGETEDPDQDMLENLLEYAFGGDPESGVLTLPNGAPLLPQISVEAGTVSIAFPERDDASVRGLTYTPEFCDDLSSWTSTPPAGLVSTTSAFDPPVPGMVKRTLTWSSADPAGFVRIGVILSE